MSVETDIVKLKQALYVLAASADTNLGLILSETVTQATDNLNTIFSTVDANAGPSA